MNLKIKIIGVIAFAAAALSPSVSLAEKISKHTVDGFDEWYWEKKITVQYGQEHTFWAKDLTENTAITGISVSSETDDGWVWASESTEVENSAGGWDLYVLLTADDWEYAPESKSLTFTVRVDGFEYDKDYMTSADIAFSFGHSDGSGDYPGETPEPVATNPEGSQANPVAISFVAAGTDTVQNPSVVSWQKPSNWDDSEAVDGKVYLNAKNLVAGRKYVFGFDGIAPTATVSMVIKSGTGENLFTSNSVSTLIASSSNACWAVVIPTSGDYEIVIDDDTYDFICRYGADAWDPQDNMLTGATSIKPSNKGISVNRTLWTDDEDWFSFAATAGYYYKFAFTQKTGAPEVRVFDGAGQECEYVIQTNPCEAVMVAVATKGTYYVKVAHAEDAEEVDAPYTLSASSANPGIVKFAKTAVTVKDSVGYVDLSVSRSAAEGATRVTYTTMGDQSSAEDALYYPTSGTLEWANGDKTAKTIRVKIVPLNYGQGGTFQVKLAAINPESESFDPEKELPAVIAADTATVTVTATAKAAPGTIQLADCATPKKPVVNVTATNGMMILKFERIGGTDGMVSVKIETADKTAKNGIDYAKTSNEFTWFGGDATTYDFEIPLVSSPDNTATKTFTVKLSANTGKAYAKPTLASSTITVNIANDRFATTVAAYSKALPKTSGIAIKESKSGDWVVDNNGAFRSTKATGTLTFTLTGPGVFKYKLEGEGEAQLVVPYGEKKNNKVVIEASDTLLWYTWEPLPENLETLRQCVKYSRVFTNGITKVASGKLPDGLKFAQDKVTKNWSISGTPTKAGYFYVKLTDTVKGKAQPTVVEELSYNVVAAGTAIGTFSGIVKTDNTDDGLRSLASVTLTAAATGKLSAKVLTGGKTYTFADTGYASFEEEGDDTVVKAELPLIQKIGTGRAAETVTNWLTCTIIDASETNAVARNAEVECEINFAKLPVGREYTDDVFYKGTLCRDNSKVADWVTEAAKFAGYYTVSLVNIDANEGEPKGNGYLTLTFDAKGKVKIAGVLADGTSYSASSVSACLVDRDGATAIRIPLYACRSTYVFGGWLELIPGDDGALLVSSDAQLVWANDALTATREGYAGFNLKLVPVGGWYDTVTNLQKWFIECDFSVDLPSWDDDFESLLPSGYETYAFAANPCGQAVDVYGNTISAVKQTLVKNSGTIVWDECVNASNVKFTFKRATGVLSGTFELWYEGVNAKTKKFEQKKLSGLKHNGVLLLSHGNDGYLEDDVWTSGFYLVPQTLSDYNELTGRSTTRKWTGSYRFDVKATYIGRKWDATPAE